MDEVNVDTMKLTDLNDDCWLQIFQYLDLKSLYVLEKSDNIFQVILKRTEIWQRKIRIQYPGVDIGKIQYGASRRLYLELYIGSHQCNVCNLCFILDVCPNIPECKKCDWLSLLD